MPRRREKRPQTAEQKRKHRENGERLKKYQFKKGQSGNPGGKNGAYWMNLFKEFAAEATEAIAGEDREGKKTQVERARNIFQASYKHALLGNKSELDRFYRLLGIDTPTQRVEVTGADGEPLQQGAQVVLMLPDAGTREDPAVDDPAAAAPGAPTGGDGEAGDQQQPPRDPDDVPGAG